MEIEHTDNTLKNPGDQIILNYSVKNLQVWYLFKKNVRIKDWLTGNFYPIINEEIKYNKLYQDPTKPWVCISFNKKRKDMEGLLCISFSIAVFLFSATKVVSSNVNTERSREQEGNETLLYLKNSPHDKKGKFYISNQLLEYKGEFYKTDQLSQYSYFEFLATR